MNLNETDALEAIKRIEPELNKPAQSLYESHFNNTSNNQNGNFSSIDQPTSNNHQPAPPAQLHYQQQPNQHHHHYATPLQSFGAQTPPTSYIHPPAPIAPQQLSNFAYNQAQPPVRPPAPSHHNYDNNKNSKFDFSCMINYLIKKKLF